MYLIPIWKKYEFYKGYRSKLSIIYLLPKEIIIHIINQKLKRDEKLKITLKYKIRNNLIEKKIFLTPENILLELFEKIKETTKKRWNVIYLGNAHCYCDICPYTRHQHTLGTINLHENTYYCGNINKKIKYVGIYPNCEIRLV